MGKKKELGKGIRALLNNIEDNSEKKSEAVKHLSSHIELLSLDSIEINPFQPRKEFDKEQLTELSESIKTYGIIQAITVRDLRDGTFQLISGERRFRASKLAGLKEIPAYIRIADDALMLEMALVENIQRENLNAIEMAISYQRLLSEFEFTHEQLSERVGKKRATISNYVRLLKLPPVIQASVKAEDISMGHARALLSIEDLALQIKLFNDTKSKELSVRALEQLIKAYKTSKDVKKPSIPTEIDPEVLKIQKNLAQKIGVKPIIVRNAKGKGEIKIPFTSDEALNNIIDALLN